MFCHAKKIAYTQLQHKMCKTLKKEKDEGSLSD